ncbi:MAG: type II toxin-antitoxin system PemK/MazF family toxin [Anaerolineae bacterium]
MGVVTQGSVRRGDVFLIELDPTRGGESQKTRPCVVVSPDPLNAHLRTFIVAPMTTGSHVYPFRVPCQFEGQRGHIVLDQVRTIDQDRLVRHLGRMPAATMRRSLAVLQEMFAP